MLELVGQSVGTQSAAGAGGSGDMGLLPVVLFYLFATVTVAGAFGAAFSRQVKHAGLGLLLAFSGVAGFFFLLQAEFLAAIQLLVFVGGTLVLLLMGIVLTAAVPMKFNGARRVEVVWTVLVAVGIGLPLMVLLAWVFYKPKSEVGPAVGVEGIGRALISAHGSAAYLIPLELLAVVFLTVIVGGAYLARPPRPLAPAGPPHIETLAPSRMVSGRRGG